MRLTAGRLGDGTRTLVRGAVLGTVLVTAAGTLAACSGQEERPAGAVRAAASLGPGEGAIDLVTLPGYVENGGTDSRVNWVTPFEERTGCKVGWRSARTPEEMTSLLSDPNRRYDGAVAPPEVTGRLIEGGHLAPVNPDLVDGYKKLEPRLRGLLKRGADVYGVPATWGSNLVMYDTQAVQPAPSGWASLLDPAQARRYSGKIVMRDSPLAIAEAALYLRSRDRKLKIKDPYSLTAPQLAAAARVLAEQRPHVQRYWEQPADAVAAFAGGGAVLGQTWPYQPDVLGRAGRQVQAVTPAEGVTGWMNAWVMGARAAHPNCVYQWLRWTASPDVQRQIAEWNGVAPANPQACSGDRLRGAFCSAHRVGDRAHLDKVIFAYAPSKVCGGATATNGERDCADYEAWVRAWHDATRK
ncbi:ABC transporter substrate-binding protein [Actinomadura kijaniata]|uniref:Putative spermidine/putrescine transport system substrate-binding protein n=1 Tax=Actinomadura namibiensis TaxID=182080 RepID=A0A7W3LJR7_ACTNM|nr:extracellular solute-binding protein [Actinomadura namibiensis]MBA8949443.1 putative spermidine/putrescine transport system substrate-binding protein [Actinomadura namibiensis]